jgi:hypothetical protein
MPCADPIIPMLEPFRLLFTAPTWKKMLILLKAYPNNLLYWGDEQKRYPTTRARADAQEPHDERLSNLRMTLEVPPSTRCW